MTGIKAGGVSRGVSTPHVTPLVRQLAQQHGVPLASLSGTGVGGRITKRDVLRAAGVSEPRAAVVPSRPRLVVEQRSAWTQANTMVMVDVYASNPLAADMQANAPDQYARARQAVGDPPGLFANGDLPLFTTSGMDPQLLLLLPWVARPAAASASAADASMIFEQYGVASRETWDAALMAYCLDTPVLAYENRMRAWGSAGV